MATTRKTAAKKSASPRPRAASKNPYAHGTAAWVAWETSPEIREKVAALGQANPPTESPAQAARRSRRKTAQPAPASNLTSSEG